MRLQYLLSAASIAVLSACAEAPAPPELTQPSLTAAHPTMANLSEAGVMLTIKNKPGDAQAVKDNPDCKTRYCTTFGRGALVDGGLVLTAAHVVTKAVPGDWVHVDIGNTHGYAQLIWRAEKWEPGMNDLAVLALNDVLVAHLNHAGYGTPLPICHDKPTMKGVAYVVGQHLLYPTTLEYREFENRLNIVGTMEPGVSGSGIVDAERGCVTAVVSAQNSTTLTFGDENPDQASGGMEHSLVSPITHEWLQQQLAKLTR